MEFRQENSEKSKQQRAYLSSRMSEIARLNRKRPLAESVERNGENLSDWNRNCPGARAKRHEAKTPQDLLEREAKAAAILFSLDSTTCGNLLIPRGKGVLIGRSRKCDIVVEPPDCSSKHCQIGSSDVGGRQAVFVKDMSTNGTFVNGTLVGKGNTCLLRDGDRISFAASCEFITKYNKKASRAGKSFFDKYILSNKVLGTGHYAQVKEAVCRETGKVCAVKIFNPRKHTLGAASKIQTNEAADEVNLDRELNILTKLDHRNVVGFYGTYLEPVSRDSVTTYLVLEEVNGGELFKRIVSKGKLRQDETQNIMCQLLTGLRYLHSMGVVHRDLKPENILLEVISGPQAAPWDAGERSVRVKIADFGLAKFIGNFSFTNTLCGTPAYVAPEVLVNQQNRHYNRAVDMWSVGVLLYVCLCGFPPFSEELGPPSMRQQIIEARYAFFSPYWDEIADDALDLISRLLVADPNRRLSVEQALHHPWLRDCAESLELVHAQAEVRAEATVPAPAPEPVRDEMLDLRAKQLSIRIPASSRGYSCGPITLKQRVESGMDDEMIARTFCHYKEDNADQSDSTME